MLRELMMIDDENSPCKHLIWLSVAISFFSAFGTQKTTVFVQKYQMNN